MEEGIYGCAAVSASTGKVAIYYASYPVAADRWDEFTGPNGALGSVNGARSLSCAFDATDNYDCVVLSGNGTYQTGTNGALNALGYVLIDGSASVSCTSATFCVAGGRSSGSTFTFNGSAFTPLAATFAPTGISCTGSFCAATNGADAFTSVSGGAWTAGLPFDPSNDAVGLSCRVVHLLRRRRIGGGRLPHQPLGLSRSAPFRSQLEICVAARPPPPGTDG